MTWYPGKQNQLTFNGEDGESFKKILASVLETNFAFKQTNTFLNSSPQTTSETSAGSERVIDKSRLTKVSVPLTYDHSCNAHAKDFGIEPIADTSTLEELEDFIDSAYYIINDNATPNRAKEIDISTLAQQLAADTLTIYGAQFLTFRPCLYDPT